MARVAWSFDSYDWPVNPEKDSGWVYEHVSSEQVPINASKSTIQFGGRKSARRQISGWIWGEQSATQFSRMRTWQRDKTQSTLVDHNGESRRALLVKFEPEYIADVREWAEGRQSYRYTAEWISLE